MSGESIYQGLPKMDFDHPLAGQRILVTGGPGFGITTTVNELSNLGWMTVREAARFVIHREIQNPESVLLPWKDREAFDDAIAEVKVHDYQKAPTDQIVFFDRGLPDFVGWSRYYDKSYERLIPIMEANPYHKTVFFTIPWEQIYEQNEERPLSYEQSERVHEILLDSYQEMGFDVRFLPKEAPRKRAQFILDSLGL